MATCPQRHRFDRVITHDNSPSSPSTNLEKAKHGRMSNTYDHLWFPYKPFLMGWDRDKDGHPYGFRAIATATHHSKPVPRHNANAREHPKSKGLWILTNRQIQEEAMEQLHRNMRMTFIGSMPKRNDPTRSHTPAYFPRAPLRLGRCLLRPLSAQALELPSLKLVQRARSSSDENKGSSDWTAKSDVFQWLATLKPETVSTKHVIVHVLVNIEDADVRSLARINWRDVIPLEFPELRRFDLFIQFARLKRQSHVEAPELKANLDTLGRTLLRGGTTATFSSATGQSSGSAYGLGIRPRIAYGISRHMAFLFREALIRQCCSPSTKA